MKDLIRRLIGDVQHGYDAGKNARAAIFSNMGNSRAETGVSCYLRFVSYGTVNAVCNYRTVLDRGARLRRK